MIKNVICDMGNVLMTWNPHALALVGSADPAEADIFEKELFRSPEWTLNDTGRYDEGELVKSIAKRIPENLIDRFYWLTENWQNYVVPIPGALEFVKWLKGKGLKVFMLSNAPSRFPECVSHYEVYKLLDGAVVSWYAKCSKPDREIYLYALEKFGIMARESVFIDDLEANIKGSEAVGIRGFVFDGDYDKLKRRLENIGV
ncbi:MAG: HAD family phosphatase [Clostridia bacterium]|nr:HAD family phosphatase [Clostridia bacterium]